MDPQVEVKLVKSGETPIQFTLDRSLSGIRVNVLAYPVVEEFMQSMGTGELQDVRTIGRHWMPVGGVDKPLSVYQLEKNPGNIALPSGAVFRIDRPGWPLDGLTDDGSLSKVSSVNLSFLRLQGISKGSGVTFTIRGVQTYDRLKILRDQLAEATSRFYVMYMKPVHFSVMLTTQEIKG